MKELALRKKIILYLDFADTEQTNTQVLVKFSERAVMYRVF